MVMQYNQYHDPSISLFRPALRRPGLPRGAQLMSGPRTPSPSGSLQTEATARLIGYRLRRAQIAVFQRFLAAFSDLGLRPAEYAMLALIAANPGRKQTEIADALGIKQANFVALVQDFEKRGVLERRPADTDRRVKALYLTAGGAAFFARAAERHDALESELVTALGGETARDALIDLIGRLD